LVQAKIDTGNINIDLTGTEIRTDNPVAVFAGQQRANVPIVHINSPSRDFLFEQMPPIETWGKNALLVPYVQPTSINDNGTDLFRILAAYDNTEIFINGAFSAKINKGEFYEGQLLQAASLETSAPVLVAQFKKTSDYGSGTILGDPFEMLIPPVEQFMSSYRVINIQSYEYYGEWFGQPIYHKVYTQQFITVVAPNSALGNVLLDGVAIPLNNFNGIPTSAFSYANIPVSDGVHTISSNEKIGVYVYGYGQANSYGYVGGMYLRSVYFQPPSITGADSCTTVIGIVQDTSVIGSKIKNVISPIESQINVTVEIEDFIPYRDTVRFRASLIDNFKDGEFEIEATDSNGLTNRKKFTIHGFTVEFPELSSNNNTFEFDSTVIGECNCDSIKIKNTGVLPFYFDHNIYLIYNTIFSIPVSQLPLIIQPGETQMLHLCFCPNQVNRLSQNDTLFLEYNCVPVKVLIKGIAKPKLETANSGCNVPIKLSIFSLPEIDFLSQNYPNPVTGNKTTINFGISEKGDVAIKIFNIFGDETKNVFMDLLDKGNYEVELNTDNLTNGIYVYTLITEKVILNRTLVIIK
jgi:hypothetical protein